MVSGYLPDGCTQAALDLAFQSDRCVRHDIELDAHGLCEQCNEELSDHEWPLENEEESHV